MTEPTAVQIHLDSDGGTGHKVYIDGQDWSRMLRGVHLDVEAKNPPRVLLDLAKAAVEVDGKVSSYLDEDTAMALLKLGWTPPADEQQGALMQPDPDTVRLTRAEVIEAADDAENASNFDVLNRLRSEAETTR